MSVREQLEEEIKELIIDVCEVMWARGYSKVTVGAIMRLIGVTNEYAENHDDHIILLDESFEELLKKLKYSNEVDSDLAHIPPGTTLH